jgi:hypothetical protein
MNVSIKKEKIIKYGIIVGLTIFIFTAGFGVGYGTQFRRIKSDCSGIEQRIDNTNSTANSERATIEDGISNLNGAINFNELTGVCIDGASVYNSQLQSEIDRLTAITKDYQESLQLANSTINDLFDLSIKRAELDEQFINSVIGVLGLSEQSAGEQ